MTTSLPLNVTRSGLYDMVTVTWILTLQSADVTDVGATTGIVVIPHGQSSVLLTVDILADDTPEVDELFVITLVTTSPLSQRIQQDQVCVGSVEWVYVCVCVCVRVCAIIYV